MSEIETGQLKRTVNGIKLMNSMMASIPFDPGEHATLNQKFNVHDNATPNTIYPTFEYFAIGNGALQSVIDADGDVNMIPKDHDATDAALFKHIPFVMRLTTNDLTSVERENYAMRVLVNHGGTNYWAYYLKRVRRVTDTITVNRVVRENGIDTVTEFQPTAANLSPTPPVIPVGEATSTDGTYYDVTLPYEVQLDSNDLAELRNVSSILKGSETALTLSEVGLVFGYRQSAPLLDTAGAPTAVNYFECIRATVCFHMPVTIPLATVNTLADLGVNLGTTDPAVGV